jgi:hypothetical protein
VTRRINAVLGLLLTLPGVSHGFDPALATGLKVSVESVDEPMIVDGVPLLVQRASGEAVPELAQRIESRWRSQGSHIRHLRSGTWTLLSRIDGGVSELVQWRSGRSFAELLASTVDVRRAPQATAGPDLRLPAGCSWGRTVNGTAQGRSFRQHSARCERGPAGLIDEILSQVERDGWEVQSRTGNGIAATRRRAQALLTLSTPEGERPAWVVWTVVDTPEVPRR